MTMTVWAQQRVLASRKTTEGEDQAAERQCALLSGKVRNAIHGLNTMHSADTMEVLEQKA